MNQLFPNKKIEEKWKAFCTFQRENSYVFSFDLNTFSKHSFFKKLTPKIIEETTISNQQSVTTKKLAKNTLKLILSDILQLPQQQIKFCKSEHGKPFLENALIHFNVSYSESQYLIALSKSQEIGIDIEHKNRAIFTKYYYQILHPVEQYIFAQLSPETKEEQLLEMWVKKEAILKGLGLGLRKPMNTFKAQDYPTIKIPCNSNYVSYLYVLSDNRSIDN